METGIEVFYVILFPFCHYLSKYSKRMSLFLFYLSNVILFSMNLLNGSTISNIKTKKKIETERWRESGRERRVYKREIFRNAKIHENNNDCQ